TPTLPPLPAIPTTTSTRIVPLLPILRSGTIFGFPLPIREAPKHQQPLPILGTPRTVTGFSEWNPTLEVCMFRRSWFVQGLAEVGLLGGLWLTGSGAALTQQPLPANMTNVHVIPVGAQVPGQEVIKSEPALPDAKDVTAPGGATENPGEAKKPEEPKPFWTKVPHLSPKPRTGNFPIPPSG